MISISKIKGFFLENDFRVFKVLQHGAKSADECSPFGFDSNPLNESTAIFLESEVSGEPVIVGYIQKNRKAQLGEVRLYSVDSSGLEKTYIHLKNNGDILIAGEDDNLVRYTKLNDAIQTHKTNIDIELNKIALAINSIVPGSYSPTLPNVDISQSKIEEIKCP